MAVCAKHVPVAALMEFDNASGNLKREGVPSEMNSFDVRALSREVAMGHSILRSGKRWGLAVGLGVVLIFPACGSDAKSKNADAKGTEATSAPGTAVAIANFAFDPQDATVAAGTKVTWTNKDDAAHNIQDLSELNTPISPDLKQGETFSITYTKPGTYKYICGLHNYMTGTVKVT